MSFTSKKAFHKWSYKTSHSTGYYEVFSSVSANTNPRVSIVILFGNLSFPVMVDSSQWKVPIAVSTSGSQTEPAVETLLENESCTLMVSGVGQGQWIKVR